MCERGFNLLQWAWWEAVHSGSLLSKQVFKNITSKVPILNNKMLLNLFAFYTAVCLSVGLTVTPIEYKKTNNYLIAKAFSVHLSNLSLRELSWLSTDKLMNSELMTREISADRNQRQKQGYSHITEGWIVFIVSSISLTADRLTLRIKLLIRKAISLMLLEQREDRIWVTDATNRVNCWKSLWTKR